MTNQNNFTEGNIKQQLFRFAIPIFFANLLQTSYQLIDSLWVGNLLGAKALAALALSGPVIFTVLSFIIGVNSATITVISQKKGVDDKEGLKDALNSFVFVLGLLAVLFGVLGWFFAPDLLRFLGAPPSIMKSAVSYLRINFVGILFLFGYNFISSVLRAMGDSKTPVRFVMLAVLLNTVLDPLLIHTLHLGIDGAAVATVLSQGAAFGYGILFSILKAGVPFSYPSVPSLQQVKTIGKLGIPAGLQMMTISAGTASITGVAAGFGQNVLAGFGASQRINNLIMIPIFTMGTAVTSMAGQNIGAKKWQRVSEITKEALKGILLISLSIGLIVFIFSGQLMHLFVRNQETITFGSAYLKSVAFLYVFLGINFVLNGVVRAAGAMFQILILNLISFWLLRFPLSYLFSRWFGPIGIGYGMGLSFVLSSFFAMAYYRWGKWRNIQLFKDGKEPKEANR